MSKKWYVEMVQSEVASQYGYYLLMDHGGKPISRFTDEKEAQHIADMHNGDIAPHNYPEPADDSYAAHRSYLPFDAEPEYPLREGMLALARRVCKLEKTQDIEAQALRAADVALSMRIKAMEELAKSRCEDLEHKFLNHQHHYGPMDGRTGYALLGLTATPTHDEEE